MLDARASGQKIGQVGLELLRITADGSDTVGDDARPRAVVTGDLFVEPQFRRQGVAQRLLREAESRARLWGMTELMLPVRATNHAALTLYAKMGYEHTGGEWHSQDKWVCLHRWLYSPNMHTLHSLRPQHNVVEDSRFRRK